MKVTTGKGQIGVFFFGGDFFPFNFFFSLEKFYRAAFLHLSAFSPRFHEKHFLPGDA